MRDFSDFKEYISNGALREIADKASDYAEKMIKQNYNENDSSADKAYAYNRYITEGTIVYLLEKYHEWANS